MKQKKHVLITLIGTLTLLMTTPNYALAQKNYCKGSCNDKKFFGKIGCWIAKSWKQGYKKREDACFGRYAPSGFDAVKPKVVWDASKSGFDLQKKIDDLANYLIDDKNQSENRWLRYYTEIFTVANKIEFNDFDYWSMKKVGTYNSGASADSPEPIEAYQDFMGVEFGKVGPWDAPYNTRNPRTWNSSDIYVPFQVDYLTGNSGCDDVIIETRVAREKSEYLQEFSARFDEHVGLAIQGNTQNRELSYIVYDIMGKTIAQGITSESSISISASTISGLRKGTYLITLRELNTNNPPHTIRINKL